MADPTAPESHEPPAGATCGERVAFLGTAHACRWAAHDGDAHACVCGCTWRHRVRGCAAAPERTLPDDTTEGLRERYAEAATQWALMYPLANYGFWTCAGSDATMSLNGIADSIAAAWGRDIADRMLAVRDAELETAHEERDAARLVSQGRTMEQYDAEAAIERVRALRGRSSMGRVNDYVTMAEVRAALDGGQ